MIRLVVSMLAMISVASRLDAQGVGGAQQPSRGILEQRLRERVAQVTRNLLGLDDAQMAKLQGVNSAYAPRVGDLQMKERETRQQLRRQMTAPTPDQSEVGRLLDSLLALQRQRISLLESEQKDLSGFLTPVQRAKYMALQAQIKRRADQLRGQNGPAVRGRAGNRPPR
jgi:Spy/CpxP family protein refolding chaperone